MEEDRLSLDDKPFDWVILFSDFVYFRVLRREPKLILFLDFICLMAFVDTGYHQGVTVGSTGKYILYFLGTRRLVKLLCSLIFLCREKTCKE